MSGKSYIVNDLWDIVNDVAALGTARFASSVKHGVARGTYGDRWSLKVTSYPMMMAISKHAWRDTLVHARIYIRNGMRRLAYVALTVIALNACIAYRVTSTDQEGNIKTREGLWLGPIPIIRRIRTELSRVEEDVSTRRAQLQPIPCGSEECYSAEDVNDAIATIRQEVRSVFPDEAVASAISLDEELENIRAELIVAEGPALIQLARNPPDGGSGAYRRRVVDRVFQRIRDRITNYLSHEELNPTMHIRSSPPGARFEIQIGSNDRTKYQTVTDNDVQSVWRGRYSGRLVKAGYRDAQPFILDLMNDSRTNVRCTLVQISASASAESNCQLEN